MGMLNLRGLDDEELEMWAGCAHECGHAVVAMAENIATESLEVHLHTPWLIGSPGTSGLMRPRGLDDVDIDNLGAISVERLRSLQVLAVAGRAAELRFRVDELGQQPGEAALAADAGCVTDYSMVERYIAHSDRALSLAQAEQRAERALDTHESRWLDLVERLEGARGRLGTGAFEWGTVEV